jgi:hypothetical protein
MLNENPQPRLAELRLDAFEQDGILLNALQSADIEGNPFDRLERRLGILALENGAGSFAQ